MASEGINQKTRIKLKKLAGIDSLTAAQINEILQRSTQWISNFYSEAAGDKKVKGDFAIEGFSYGGEFDLSTAQDILDGVAPTEGSVPFLFLSDLVNFIEEIRTSLGSEKISLDSVQRAELDKLGSTFQLVGVSPVDEKVSVEDLQRIEYIDYSRRIVERIRLIYLILKPSLGSEEIKIEEKAEEVVDGAGVGGGTGAVFPFSGKKQGQDNQKTDESQKQRKDQEPKQTRDDQANKQPIKISELDPEAKLYLQSLSIITINQALSKYFNAASLAKLGLPEGMQVTFDQLPLEVRRQLMDRAFLQVEGLLLSGQFSLDSLIKEQSQRIIFSSQAALGLLMDVHGLKLLNDAVRDIASRGNKAEQKIKENEKEKLTNEKVSPRVKTEKENVLDTKTAQDVLEKSSLTPNFAKAIESELEVIGDEKRLEDVFSEKIRQIIGGADNVKVRLVVENIRPLVEVFIQQGLPPEYLIPDPKNFDYNRFVNVFGNSLDRSDFNKHKEELANLIIFYWKRKRAIWATEIREEFAQERYTPEEAQKLYEAIKKDPKRIAELRNLGALNLTYGGRQVAEELAGETAKTKTSGERIAEELSGAAEGTTGSIEAEQFKVQQKELIEKFLEQEIAKLNKADQQKELKVYFEFYMPGVEFTEYNIEIFQTQIAPQINPMDFYMMQAAETMGAGSFAKDGSGYIQRAFAPDGDYQGTGLMDSAIGKAGKKAATEAIGQGLYLALDAAGGWGEALRTAEAAAPFLKKIKDQMIEMGLEKILEFIKKHWPLIVLALALGALAFFLPWLLALAPAYFLLRNGLGGLKDFFSGGGQALGKIGGGGIVGGRANLANQIAPQAGKSLSQSPEGAKTLLNQFSSSAMVTAGQAVLAAAGSGVLFVFIYQTSLNSAFLTDFPKNESEINNSVEKTSKYAEISKTASIKTGCSNPENDGAKCENPSFPVTIEYTVTIKPKEDFTLQITDISDTIKFKQSKKGWEEAGQTPPSIESEKVLDFAYFQEIIKNQGGSISDPINTDPIPTIGLETEETNTTETEGAIVIPAGGSLTFTYALDDLGSNYNHTSIVNTIEAKFYYQNSYMSGMDNVITAARVCLGNCSAGAGCWPTTGTIWQLPFGDYSHSPPNAGGYGDSYDIGCDSCSGAAIYGPPVYANFDGNLCFKGCDDNQYGCRYILEFQFDGQTMYEDFAHFQEPNPALSTPNSCMQVEAGFMIALMSNRGMGDVHSHFGTVIDAGGGWWGSKPASSITEQLVPETDNGNYPPKIGDHVTSCYD